MRTELLPGSYDPVTWGHLEVAMNELKSRGGDIMFAVGFNSKKKDTYLFSVPEREALIRFALQSKKIKKDKVSVTSYSGLLAHFCVRYGYKTVCHGGRGLHDFEDAMVQDEVTMTQLMAGDMTFHYAVSSPGQKNTSSSALKELLSMQGEARHMAPLSSIHAVQARLLGQYLYGVTGVSGAGKNYTAKKFAEIAKRRNIPLFSVDLDDINRKILTEDTETLYVETRQKIAQAFGRDVLDDEGFVIKKKLREIVVGDRDKLKQLERITHKPIFFRMNDFLRGRKGIFLINAALLAETDQSSMVNNQLLLVKAAQKEIARRLSRRDLLTPEQLGQRIATQFTTQGKMATLRQNIRDVSYGNLQVLDTGRASEVEYEKAFDVMLCHVDVFGQLRVESFLKRLGVSDAEAAYTDVRKKFYSGSERYYHNLHHIVDGLNQLPDFIETIKDRDAFMLAWIFHDAVYDSREKDNEEKSVLAMQDMCASWGIDPDLVERACAFIRATKYREAHPKNEDEKLFVDLDFSVFGKSVQEFLVYEDNIRREHAWMTDKQWKVGRQKFLLGLENACFHTDFFKDRYACQAQKNIKRSLKSLDVKARRSTLRCRKDTASPEF